MTGSGLLGCLDNHVVDFVFYENSDNIDDGTEDSNRVDRSATNAACKKVSNLENVQSPVVYARL